jgi:hypothetical protein
VLLPQSAEKRLIVFGDVHGDLESLIQILQQSRFFERVAQGEDLLLVGLGDYINKGRSSLETLYCLATLLTHPVSAGKVVLLRGNHENGKVFNSDSPSLRSKLEQEINRHAAFSPRSTSSFLAGRVKAADLTSLKNEAWASCKRLFNELPIMAVASNGLVLAHSGYSRVLASKSRREGDNLLRTWPPPPQVLTDLLWSDITSGKQLGFSKDGTRVTSCPTQDLFEMLTRHNCSLLLRGHQYHPPVELDQKQTWRGGAWWIGGGRGRGNPAILTVNSTIEGGKADAVYVEVELSPERATKSCCKISLARARH